MAAAPLYLQSEVDELLAMAKRIPDSDVSQPRTAKQKRRVRRRAYPGETFTILQCVPADGRPGIAFEVEVCRNLRNDSVVVQLFAQISPRPMRPICHYDIHDTPHENPPWFPPAMIDGGQFHRHVYSERAIRETDEDAWEACATPLDLGLGGSPNALEARLRKRFLDDLNIVFDDGGTRGLFMKCET